MELRNHSPFRNRQPTTSIPATHVHGLEDLGALVADRKVSNATQIRLSHGNWKLKPQPGAGTVSKIHALDAVRASDALLSKALSARQCSAVSPSLAKLLRPAASDQLSAGDLRKQLHVLAMLDAAMGEGPRLDANSACSLIETVLENALEGDEAQVIAATKHAAGFMKSQNKTSGEAWRAACEVFFRTPPKDDKALSAGR